MMFAPRVIKTRYAQKAAFLVSTDGLTSAMIQKRLMINWTTFKCHQNYQPFSSRKDELMTLRAVPIIITVASILTPISRGMQKQHFSESDIVFI